MSVVYIVDPSRLIYVVIPTDEVRQIYDGGSSHGTRVISVVLSATSVSVQISTEDKRDKRDIIAQLFDDLTNTAIDQDVTWVCEVDPDQPTRVVTQPTTHFADGSVVAEHSRMIANYQWRRHVGRPEPRGSWR